MLPRRLIVAATIASFGLAFAGPALTAPVPCSITAECMTLAQHKRQDDRRYRDEDRSRDRDRRYQRDWDRDRSRWRWEYERRERWRTKRHPRHDHWVGQHLPPRRPYMVILDWRNYDLPRPRPGYAYVRVDRDVFLIAEATKRIIDAFVLLEAVGR